MPQNASPFGLMVALRLFALERLIVMLSFAVGGEGSGLRFSVK
jgi:hypothetical protein